jgi:ribosomal protein L11 methylase PrmA
VHAAQPARPGKDRQPAAIYVPTPPDVVALMLKLAAPKKTETVVDLGCGDGRIVVAAARKYGCKAVGYDIDPELVQMARDNVKKNEVGGRVTIEQKDLFTVDLGKVDVVALYLPTGMNRRLLPRLERLRPGARVVCHAFALPGIRPDREVAITSTEDRLEHKVFLYTAPLKKEKTGPP